MMLAIRFQSRVSMGNGGAMPKVTSSHVVALYRPGEGRVVHVHAVRVFEGGRPVTRDEAEKAARANAERRGHDIRSLKIVYTDELPGDFGRFHVDAVSGRLVGTEAPPRKRLEKLSRD